MILEEEQYEVQKLHRKPDQLRTHSDPPTMPRPLSVTHLPSDV
jgi:hypothetical protein